MNKKSKVFVVFCVLLASVVLLTCTCFAAVDSDFQANGDNTAYTADEVYNVSVCPQLCTFYKSGSYSNPIRVKISNDLDRDYTLTIIKIYGTCTSSYVVPVDGVNTSYTLTLNEPVVYVLHAGDVITLSVGNRSSSGSLGTDYYYDKVQVSFSPDPQHVPTPVEVLLDSVSDFLTSFFTQASDIVSMIVSSWVFLVPVTMMLVVFFVMAIRKIVKGV